jgi:hypothetical protein
MKSSRIHKLAVSISSAALLLLATPHGEAQIITENPNELDTGIANDGSGNLSLVDTTDYEVRIGEYYAPGGEAYVMPFQLPTLAAGEVITAAQLQTQLYSIFGTPSDADLYGIGAVGSPTVSTTANVSTSYYYQGPLDTSNTLLQADFLTPDSTVRTDPTAGPFVTTNLVGDAALVTFLNDAEDGGANAGDYVFLRLSYDATTIPTGNNAYEVLTEDAGGTYEKPLLTIAEAPSLTSTPEPTSWALLTAGLLSLGVLGRRLRTDS